jgi:hypothetical protein
MTQLEFVVHMAGIAIAASLVLFSAFRYWNEWVEPGPPLIPGDANRLKTVEPYFTAVFNGEKTFELRKADRDFRPGQVWYLVHYTKHSDYYSGSWVKVRITYVCHHESEGIKSAIMPGYCVWGFRVLERYDAKLNLHLNERGLMV